MAEAYLYPVQLPPGKYHWTSLMPSATSRYLSQWWYNSVSPHGDTRPQWINLFCLVKTVGLECFVTPKYAIVCGSYCGDWCHLQVIQYHCGWYIKARPVFVLGAASFLSRQSYSYFIRTIQEGIFVKNIIAFLNVGGWGSLLPYLKWHWQYTWFNKLVCIVGYGFN